MQLKKKVHLQLEALEDRWVPATIRYFGGTLQILLASTDGSKTLTVTQDAATQNKFSVAVGTSSLGTYTGVGNLYITGNTSPDTIVVNPNGNTYTGNLYIFNGNGANSDSIGAGTINGNTTILAGNSATSLSLPAGFSEGGTFQFNGGNGNNNFTTNGVRIGGDLNLSRTNVNLGADNIGGSVNITDSQFNFNTSVTLNGTSVGQAVNITTGLGSDSVTLNNGTTVNGNVGITAGSGNNNFATNGTVTLNSNLNYSDSGSAGTDSVTLSAGTTVGGNAAFTLSDGNNHFHSSDAVGGSFSLSLGNGITNNDTTIGGSIGANATLTPGGGNDSVTVMSNIGGTLFWQGSQANGNDSLDLEAAAGATALNPTVYTVNLTFGSGNNTLTFGPDVVVYGSANLGSGSNNHLVDNSAGGDMLSYFNS